MLFPALYVSLPSLIQMLDMERLVSGYISLETYCWFVIVSDSEDIPFVPWENARDNYFPLFSF